MYVAKLAIINKCSVKEDCKCEADIRQTGIKQKQINLCLAKIFTFVL